MPYVLREAGTGRLLARAQVNGYRLPYYGVVLWDTVPTGEEIRESLAQAGEAGETASWQPEALTEHHAKMANVKLRNDPRRQVFWNDNQLSASFADSRGE